MSADTDAWDVFVEHLIYATLPVALAKTEHTAGMAGRQSVEAAIRAVVLGMPRATLADYGHTRRSSTTGGNTRFTGPTGRP